MDNRNLGKLVRSYRESRGMTQDAFADKCKLTKVSISRIERGYRPSVQSMIVLSDILKVSFEDLISRYHSEDCHNTGPRKGADHPRSKLTKDQVILVRGRWRPSMGLREMAAWIKGQFGVEVSESWVSYVVRNLRHVV